jgi:thiol-disulfide isomerase/thioredoxin
MRDKAVYARLLAKASLTLRIDDMNVRFRLPGLSPRLAVALGAFIFAALVTSHAAQPTFKIGDRAPAIEPITWLQGNPVSKYDPGRVYVIEFWATWCPPCIKTIPHLSALQQKYPTTLTIVGVNAEGLLGFEAKPDAVRDFMSKHGKEMAYTVAMENPVKQTISKTWVTATGSMGAPTAGIVDRHGKLVWIGYPDVAKGYTFDQALEDTLAGKVDLAQSRALQSKLSQETEAYWAGKSHKPS